MSIQQKFQRKTVGIQKVKIAIVLPVIVYLTNKIPIIKIQKREAEKSSPFCIIVL